MLRLTADVNGQAIAYVYIHNTGEFEHYEDRLIKGGHLYTYNAGLWTPGAPAQSVMGVEGFRHIRELGWIPLARNVLSAAARALKIPGE